MTTRATPSAQAAPLPSPDLSSVVSAPPRSRVRLRWDRIGVVAFALALAVCVYGFAAWVITGGWRAVLVALHLVV